MPPSRRPAARAAGLLSVLALLGGCSDDGGEPSGGSAAPRSAPPGAAPPDAAPPAARAGDERVIRGWSRALSAGDVPGAARFFAVPSTVANGTPPIELTSAQLTREFNTSLPCGARLLATQRIDDYTVATFRLAERTGGDCGSGAGNKAATAFLIRDGKIVEWRRVAVPEPQPERPKPDPSPPV